MLVNEERLNPNEAAYLATMFLISAAEKKLDRDVLTLDAEELRMRAQKSKNLWVSTDQVNKAISEKIFKVRKTKIFPGSRRKYVSLGLSAPFYLALYRRMNVPLKQGQKKEFCIWVDWLSQKIIEDSFDINESFALGEDVFLKVNKLHGKWAKLAHVYSEDRNKSVEIDPKIMGGTPVVAGTRIPVYSLEARIDAGEKIVDITDDYPHLTQKAIRSAIAFARTHPRQGRRMKVANKIN